MSVEPMDDIAMKIDARKTPVKDIDESLAKAAKACVNHSNKCLREGDERRALLASLLAAEITERHTKPPEIPVNHTQVYGMEFDLSDAADQMLRDSIRDLQSRIADDDPEHLREHAETVAKELRSRIKGGDA